MKSILYQVCVIILIRLTLGSGCTKYVAYTVSATKKNSYSYSYGCGIFGWSTCYKTKYSIGYVTTYMSQLQCCLGYGGAQCLPICNNPSCTTNMECTLPQTCTCITGWEGSDCLTAICSPACGTNMKCSTPNNCICKTGWTGTDCQTAVCNPPCGKNKGCTSPNSCTCVSGWKGTDCLTPVCNPPCGKNKGCTSPNSCTCVSSWKGTNCLIPVCNPDCGTNMECVLPDTCQCINGWNGSDCQIDIDECSIGNDTCEDGCTNTNGSYSCYCSEGQILANDNEKCLGAVKDVTVKVLKYSITMTWSPPVNYSYDGTLAGYKVSCDDGVLTETSLSTTSYTVPSLDPFTSYECCIKPYWNKNGEGPSVCKATTTLEDAPSDTPHNINMFAGDSESILIEWSPPLISNGIITHYNIYINYTNGSDIDIRYTTDGSGSTLYLLEHLDIYQLVGVSISATTIGGEGPQSPYTYNRSAALPSYFIISVITDRSIDISWHPSTFIEEGLSIDDYHILIRNLTEDNHDTAMYTWALNSSNSTHEIKGLKPYVPYEVSIVNTSTDTNGAAIQVHREVFFTSESVPITAPVWSLINRESISTIRLAWTPLTLQESRGFITNYTVRYADVNHSSLCSVEAIQNITGFKFITTNSTLITLTDLTLRSQYCISIGASTVVGYGVYSQWEVVEVAENQHFVFFIDKIPSSCEEWIQQNIPTKLIDFSNELAAVMNDSCPDYSNLIPYDYIYKTPSFLPYCTDDGLGIIETTLFIYETLFQTILDWVEESPNVTMNGTVVTVEFFCTSSNNCSYLPQYQSVTAWPFLNTPSLKADQPLPNSTLSLLLSPSDGFKTTQVEVDTVNTSQYIIPLIITMSIVTILVAAGTMFGCVLVLLNKRKKSRSGYELKENHSLSTISGKQNSSVDLPNPCYDGLTLSTVGQHQLHSTTPTSGDHDDPADGHEYEETSYGDNTVANYSLIDSDDGQNETLRDINNIYYEGTPLPLNNTTTSTISDGDDVDHNDTHQAEYSFINNDQQNGMDIKLKPNCYTDVPPSPAINAVYQELGLGQVNDPHCVGNESEYSHLNHTGWNQIDMVTQNITPEDYLDPCTVVHIKPSADSRAAQALKEAKKPVTQQNVDESADESCIYSLANEVYST